MIKLKSIIPLLLLVILSLPGCSSKKETGKSPAAITMNSPSPSVSLLPSPSPAQPFLVTYNKTDISHEEMIDNDCLIISLNLGVEKMKNYDQFMQCLFRKDFRKASLYLEKNPALVNAPNEKYMAPIQVAAEEGREDIVFFLLKHGAYINVKGYIRIPPLPLYIAAFNGDDSMVKLLMRNGADTDEPLERAIRERSRVALMTLLNNGLKLRETHLRILASRHSYVVFGKYREDYVRISDEEILALINDKKYWDEERSPLEILKNIEEGCKNIPEVVYSGKTVYYPVLNQEYNYKRVHKFLLIIKKINRGIHKDKVSRAGFHIGIRLRL